MLFWSEEVENKALSSTKNGMVPQLAVNVKSATRDQVLKNGFI